LVTVGQCEPDLFPGKRRRSDLRLETDGCARVAYPRESVGLTGRHRFPNYQIDASMSSENHERRIKRRVPAAYHGHTLALVIPDLWDLIVDIFRIELVEQPKPSGEMQKAKGDNHLAAQVTVAACDHFLQTILVLDLGRVLDTNKLFIEAKLNERVDGLAIGTFGELFAGDAVGKPGNVHDPLVGIEELRLSSGPVLGFDDERRERPVSGRQTGCQPRRTGADDDNIPVGQMTKIQIGFECLDIEICHECFLGKGSATLAFLAGSLDFRVRPTASSIVTRTHIVVGARSGISR